MTSISRIDQIIQSVINGELLEEATTQDLIYTADKAVELIEASDKLIKGDKDQKIYLNGTIQGDVVLQDEIESSIEIHGTINGNLHLGANSTVRALTICCTVTGNIVIFECGYVSNDFILGSAGVIKGFLAIGGGIQGDLRAWGTVEDNIYISGEINGQFELHGILNGQCVFQTKPPVKTKITSLQVKLHTKSYFNDSADLSECDFRGFPSFDMCEFSGVSLFKQERSSRNWLSPAWEKRQQIKTGFKSPDNTEEGFISNDYSDSSQISIYRQIRRAYENSGNKPAASDFYFREMEARRTLLKNSKRLSLERGILFIYKHLSSFGLNPLRAVLWFVLLWLVSCLAFKIFNIETIENQSVILFTLKSMITFLNPPEASPNNNMVTALQIFLQLVGPILLAQIALATREKIVR